jgi:hypothetical protein
MVTMRDVVRSRYPDIELEELHPHFPRMVLPDDPALGGYSWQDCHFILRRRICATPRSLPRELYVITGKSWVWTV